MTTPTTTRLTKCRDTFLSDEELFLCNFIRFYSGIMYSQRQRAAQRTSNENQQYNDIDNNEQDDDVEDFVDAAMGRRIVLLALLIFDIIDRMFALFLITFYVFHFIISNFFVPCLCLARKVEMESKWVRARVDFLRRKMNWHLWNWFPPIVGAHGGGVWSDLREMLSARIVNY